MKSATATSLACIERSTAEVADTTLFPTYGTADLKWKLKGSAEWTSGFYPGCLWYAYELSNDARFERWACQWTAGIGREMLNPATHDLGFRFMSSFGNGLRLMDDRLGYRDSILTAAATLDNLFNPAVGCIRSGWDEKQFGNSCPVLIDIMGNLELLFWASKNGGSPVLADHARTHAITTCRDFIRPDGGTYHIVRYNETTGTVINKGTLQGAGDETTWSRGHAWGLYGMIVVYRYTHEQQFLATAIRLADYFLAHLPDDHVAPWDFQSPVKKSDASATSVVASALLELATYLDGPQRDHYVKEAETLLAALCRPPYFTEGHGTNCILDHSVHNLPRSSNVDVPSIFADYYFLEALVRYRGMREE